jgi:hypothetical protein
MIFKYLKVMLDIGLWYPIGKYFTMKTYTNADWVGSVDDRKITSGGAFFLGKNIVSWFNNKKS